MTRREREREGERRRRRTWKQTREKMSHWLPRGETKRTTPRLEEEEEGNSPGWPARGRDESAAQWRGAPGTSRAC
jgi:hypothetical protein